MSDLSAAQHWLAQYARQVRPQVARVVGLGLLQSVLLVVQAFIIASLIHAVVVDGTPRAQLAGIFALWLGVLVLRALLAHSREQAAFQAGARVRGQVRGALLRQVLALGPAGRGDISIGDLSNTVLERVEALEGYFAHYLPQRHLAALAPLLILLVVFPLNWMVGLLLLLSVPLVPLCMALVGRRAAAANQRQFQTMGRMSAHFLDRLRGLPTLRLLDREQAEREEVVRVADDFRRRTMKVLRIAFLSSTLLELFTALAIAMSAVYLAKVLLGEVSMGVIWPVDLRLALFMLLLAPEFYLPLRQLGVYYHARAEAVGAAESIAALLAMQPARRAGKQQLHANQVAVRFENVSLAFDGGRRAALRGTSFHLEPGERVALVGPSGAGKSTVVNLLLGFLQADSGVIRVNDIPLQELDPASWWQHLGWIGQHPMLFHTTLRENIVLGREVSETRLQHVVELSGVGQFLAGLPEGLDTPLGEQGAGLSGGQAQRVALARALLIPAPLMVLDEPTASLDNDTERWVLNALTALARDTTVLLVSHRLASIRAADRVLVLVDGQVAESGDHRALFNRDSLYRQLLSPTRDLPSEV